ncbi:MAG TPA: ABC transporter permease subunit [Thermoanaerobaculia bacterium]|nr:ABC transporter permease subunit [Thermoanaerobaculia bacterium]
MIERWGRRRMAWGYLTTAVVAVISLLPPLVAVSHSFRAPESEQWSGSSYEYVMTTYGNSLSFSLRLALFVVIASLVIAMPAAIAFARFPFRFSSVIEELIMTPLSLPGISIAIAVIIGYNSLRGNWLLLAMAQMLYTIPYVVRILGNSLRLLPLDELEDAARTLGAGRYLRYRHVIAPLIVHPTVLASLIVFAISWGEFNVSFLLATPTQLTFPAALFATYTSNSLSVAGAATAIFILGAVPFFVAFQLLERRPFEGGQGV